MLPEHRAFFKPPPALLGSPFAPHHLAASLDSRPMTRKYLLSPHGVKDKRSRGKVGYFLDTLFHSRPNRQLFELQTLELVCLIEGSAGKRQ